MAATDRSDIESAHSRSEPEIVVSAAWLADHPECVIADVRWALGIGAQRDDFEAGHLPGAIFIDLDQHLADTRPHPATDGRHPLPTADAFATSLGALGIAAADTVVAYDAVGGGIASRFVWMLRSIGHPAALLDGGLKAFTGALETGAGTPRRRAHVAPRPWPTSMMVSADDVTELVHAGVEAGIVFDARSAERYQGSNDPADPRPGHIPGARSAPWASNLATATGMMKSPAELLNQFEALGAHTDRPVIISCGSGVTACCDAVALTLAGFSDVRIFVPSWSGWASDPSRPVATGPNPEGS
jgi:thiosulfate/3-mercaptopyruvate sulfurtransferase